MPDLVGLAGIVYVLCKGVARRDQPSELVNRDGTPPAVTRTSGIICLRRRRQRPDRSDPIRHTVTKVRHIVSSFGPA
ncbi:hypothetical protein ACFCYH_02960 [Streptomyces sp. NPDC056400]|uniref:hypothetical protein n=1 Tax=Streptomyces sp. NPDC056400 TaxID=3345808 RepID=UPI0035E0088B